MIVLTGHYLLFFLVDVDINHEDEKKQEEIIDNNVVLESEKMENVLILKQTEPTINNSTGKLIFNFV